MVVTSNIEPLSNFIIPAGMKVTTNLSPFSVGCKNLLESGKLDEGTSLECGMRSMRRASTWNCIRFDACIQTEHDEFKTGIPSPFLEKNTVVSQKKMASCFFLGCRTSQKQTRLFNPSPSTLQARLKEPLPTKSTDTRHDPMGQRKTQP